MTHTAPLRSGLSSRANPILWPLVANKKLASGRQVHILFWASPACPALVESLPCTGIWTQPVAGLDFLTNNQPTEKFYLLLPQKISLVFARLSTSSTMYLQLYCQFYLLLSKKIKRSHRYSLAFASRNSSTTTLNLYRHDLKS